MVHTESRGLSAEPEDKCSTQMNQNKLQTDKLSRAVSHVAGLSLQQETRAVDISRNIVPEAPPSNPIPRILLHAQSKQGQAGTITAITIDTEMVIVAKIMVENKQTNEQTYIGERKGKMRSLLQDETVHTVRRWVILGR